MEKKECIVCCTINEKGILINNEFICEDCEKRIVECDLLDEQYDVYLNIIKKEVVEKHLENYI